MSGTSTTVPLMTSQSSDNPTTVHNVPGTRPLAGPSARTTEPTRIQLRPSTPYELESYGIIYRSVTDHAFTGPNLHNRNSLHELTVWDNTVRPRDDTSDSGRYRAAPYQRHMVGRYIDPSGLPTDEPVSVTTSAQATVIANTPIDRKPIGDTLQVGDVVTLVFPPMQATRRYLIIARPLNDPELIAMEA